MQAVVAEVVAGPVVLIAHDLGTSVATELLARDLEGRLPCDRQRAVLTNGSVILEKASLRPIQKVLRGPLGPVAAGLANRRMFTKGFARLFTAEHPLSAEEADAQWALLSHDGGHRIAHLLISYLWRESNCVGPRTSPAQQASRYPRAARCGWKPPVRGGFGGPPRSGVRSC
ncbi:MAG: hydrolase [Mycobacterium sp.]|nr:hydrolase [Mycobacterium sp.]